MVPRFAFRRIALALVALLSRGVMPGADFPEPINTELRGNPISAEEAVRGFSMPDGFRATVFAAEPDVRQPIAMTTDPRGRLWVAENYTYADSKNIYETKYNDRILIFEDTDGDGHFDKRTVFWDQGKVLTSIEVGLGGVFALCPPRLLFIPDRNGDGIPDGEPEVLLDGFNNISAGRHAFPNGLKWGPDGWLWGRVGISTGLRVGRPGAPDSERVEMRGGIWRYHPQRRVFEAVCHGTANPWGLDWNEVGEPFFINTVIGHLWHAIPGAHFTRLHGDDVNPHSYVLINQHADHYHFDTGAGWVQSRAAADGSFAPGIDALGGGHAHAGLMIYQGDNWPDRYRGRLFTLNFYGRRVNQERLERIGSGYVGRHEPDFLRVSDTWFRGLDLVYSPDGGVFISDWSDTGECHENDGVHRTSGRVYKVVYGEPGRTKGTDLTRLSDAELVPLVFHRNEWTSRQARRVLANRAAEGRDLRAAGTTLLMLYGEQADTPGKLRALWALHIIGKASPSWLLEQTKSPDEYIRSWAVRLLTDWSVEVHSRGASAIGSAERKSLSLMFGRFRTMGRSDPSAFVRLYLASAMQRLPVDPAARLAMELVQHSEDAGDHNLGPMLWFGIEPWVAAHPQTGIELAYASHFPIVRRLITRRLGEMMDGNLEPISELLARAATVTPSEQLDILGGLDDALRGWRKAPMPSGWKVLAERFKSSTNIEVRKLAGDLGLLFGDGRALEDMRTTAADPKEDYEARRHALNTLMTGHADNLAPLLKRLINESPLCASAAAALLKLGDPDAPALAVSHYANVGPSQRPTLLSAIVTRPSAARLFLDEIDRGKISRSDLSPFYARQIASLNDPALAARLTEVWGVVRPTDAQKQEQIASLRKTMVADRIKSADLPDGRALFDRLCATCHQLYGEGGHVGPDLTGSGRHDLDYLLSNIIDPSAVVPVEFRMSVITLKDGRILNGIVRDANDRTITVQTPTEPVFVERKEITAIEPSAQSMMPEGLLATLKESEIRDLFGYLMGSRQVPPTVNK